MFSKSSYSYIKSYSTSVYPAYVFKDNNELIVVGTDYKDFEYYGNAIYSIEKHSKLNIMKKVFILFLGLILLLTLSCDEDNDAIVLSHKLYIEVERTSDNYITFSWNNFRMNNQEVFILIKTSEEKDFDFYKEIVDFYINYDDEDEWPYWAYECEINYISQENRSYDKFTWNDTHYYYKLLAYNLNGDYVFSNIIRY